MGFLPMKEQRSSLEDGFFPDLIASAASKVALPDPLQIGPVGEPEHGDIVLARVQEVNPAYPNLETASASEVRLSNGDVILGTPRDSTSSVWLFGKASSAPHSW